MLLRLGICSKSLALFIGSQGITISKGLGNLVKDDIVTNEKKEIDINTLVEVVKFNFLTQKVRIKCIKDIHLYYVEVNFKYLLDKCVFEEKQLQKPIEAIYAKYYIQNVLDKDTAMFILVMVLTYVCGMFIGKIF